MTMQTPTVVLGKLLSPVSVDTFFASYWQKHALSIERDNSDYFDDILTVDEIDALLADVALPVSQVNLGMNAVGVPIGAYSNGAYVNPADVIRLHREGNTIILRAMHMWLPKLRELCEAIESVFLCEVQTNLYLTPANTQSSYPHWDAHDIFVIQVAGSKRWVIHESEMQLPLSTFEFDRARHPIGPAIDEIVIRAGDLAYIPRGLAHSPVANDYSVHIALGIKVKTWADVLAVMLKDAILSDPQCRAALPVEADTFSFDKDACAPAFKIALRALLQKGRLSAALHTLQNEFLSTRRTKTRGALAAISRGSPVTLETLVEVPRGTVSRFENTGDAYDVIFNGVRLSVSPEIANSFAFLRREGSFRIRDLPASSDADRVAIGRKLIDEGCVVVCAD